jgi:hypothetical protein
MTWKLIVWKHVHAPPRRNAVRTESHSDGQRAGYFPRNPRTLLLALGYSEPQLFVVSHGCFMGTHTFGVCVWSSMRGLWPIIFTASAMWLRLPHRGGCSREAWERLHEKLWRFCDIKRRNKWSNRSTTTSRTVPEKELKPWCHTWFLCQNRVLIVWMTQDQLFHTYGKRVHRKPNVII